mgnify:CR=1 FL=1
MQNLCAFDEYINLDYFPIKHYELQIEVYKIKYNIGQNHILKFAFNSK